MRYLRKNIDSPLINSGLLYEKYSHRNKIRNQLLLEQHHFCAYSERYLCAMDEPHIEHFDSRLKGTERDDYYNWYATFPYMNSHKGNISDYQPILTPGSPEIFYRIQYNIQHNIFTAVDLNDKEAFNLIEFLGFNRPDVMHRRGRHIRRVQQNVLYCNGDILQAMEIMSEDKDNFSFATALEAIFAIDLTNFIDT